MIKTALLISFHLMLLACSSIARRPFTRLDTNEYNIPRAQVARGTASSDCGDFELNQDLHLVRDLIQKEGMLPRTVKSYVLSSQAIVYTSSAKFPYCAFVERHGQTLYAGTLRQSLIIPNGLYNFLQSSPPFMMPQSKPSPEIAEILKANHVEKALVLNVDNPYPPPFDSWWPRILAGVALHEGFHFFYQFEHGAWDFLPSNDLQKEIVKTCYLRDSNITKLVTAEVSKLNAGLALNTSAESIKSILREFVALRKRRYFLLDEERIAGESCETLENKMEFIEGLARFVEIFALDKLNLVTENPVMATYFQFSDHNSNAYYPLGMLQLMILAKLHPGTLHQDVIVPLLAAPPPESTIFGQVQEAIR